MAVNYANLAATAERLIGENGRNVTLKRISTAPADALVPWGPKATTTDIVVVKAVLIPWDIKEIDGDIIRNADKRFYISETAFVAAAAAVTPTPAHAALEDYTTLLDSDGSVWRILAISPINPGSTRIMFDLKARQ